jgi:hypothetical protein
MKITPQTKQEWCRLMALPFKIYLFAYALFYPFWRFSQPGRIAAVDWSLIDKLDVGNFISFVALLVIACFQVFIKDRRYALRNAAFASVAFIFFAGVIFRSNYR